MILPKYNVTSCRHICHLIKLMAYQLSQKKTNIDLVISNNNKFNSTVQNNVL